MKVKHYLFSIIAAAFLTSGMYHNTDLEVGKKAPVIETTEGINVGYDANSEAKKMVVSFWNPKNPESRMTNKKLSRQYGANNPENIDFISICTDSDEGLMQEVMKIDGVRTEGNYAYSQINPRTFKDYNVKENPKAFLISANGKIEKIL